MKTIDNFFKIIFIAFLGVMFVNPTIAQNFNGGNADGFDYSMSIPADFENIASVGNIKPDYYKLTVFPNPSDGLVSIVAEELVNHNFILDIMDLSGRKYELPAAEIEVQGNIIHFDLSDKPAGLYMVRVISDNKIYIAKINIY